jgi:hypothetical protein
VVSKTFYGSKEDEEGEDTKEGTQMLIKKLVAVHPDTTWTCR